MKKLLAIEEKSVSCLASSGREEIKLGRRELPCVILMPEVNGWRVLQAIRADPATARIPFIFLTAKTELPALRTRLNLGADEDLVNPVHLADLLAAVKARLERAQPFASAAIDFSSAKPLEELGLSAREAEILLRVTRGKTNKEIANDLAISAGTVRKHVENIYRKMSVTTRNAAAMRAVETLGRPL